MAHGRLAIGGLNSLDEVKKAIRDIESWLAVLLPLDAPDSTFVLARDAEGHIRQYELVSGGGCTITVDDSAETITISVP